MAGRARGQTVILIQGRKLARRQGVER